MPELRLNARKTVAPGLYVLAVVVRLEPIVMILSAPREDPHSQIFAALWLAVASANEKSFPKSFEVFLVFRLSGANLF